MWQNGGCVATISLTAPPRFGYGWAKPPPRERSTMHDHVSALLTQWFREGEVSGKTKCSAARALECLCAAMLDGTEDLEEDDLPDETHIKRFLSSLAAKKRQEVKDHAAGGVVV
jgi:hypothetical protein